MKIVAGLGSIDDYEDYCQAGADELFCGYIPGEYMLKYGRHYPLNRREVMYYNVQIGSESELMILKQMIIKKQVPVTIAMNALTYPKELYKDIVGIVRKCMDMGYSRYIVADRRLVDKLSDIEGIQLTVSGELGELNTGVLKALKSRTVKRFIFPRQTTLSEMKILCSTFSDEERIEYEAFAMNEKCHFTGAYCNSYHCDELCHICRLPYKVAPVDRKEEEKAVNGGLASEDREVLNDRYVVGATGCALCHLWKMKQAGVTHLKLVSRGNSTEDTITDIRMLSLAVDILEEAETEEEYIGRLFRDIFPNGCSRNCYAEKGAGWLKVTV